MTKPHDTTRQVCANDHRRASTYLGSWVCPSGNSVDVFVDQDALGRYHTWHYWDQPPPLLPADRTYYLTVIRPEVVRVRGMPRIAPGTDSTQEGRIAARTMERR